MLIILCGEKAPPLSRAFRKSTAKLQLSNELTKFFLLVHEIESVEEEDMK